MWARLSQCRLLLRLRSGLARMTPSDEILRRQEKDFQITVWAGSPDVRATAALAVDNGGFPGVDSAPACAGGSPTVLRYKRSLIIDNAQSYLCLPSRHDFLRRFQLASDRARQLRLLLLMNVERHAYHSNSSRSNNMADNANQSQTRRTGLRSRRASRFYGLPDW